MADTKISAFTAASALGGTELLGGVQGGANRKITIDQIKTYCRTRSDASVGYGERVNIRSGMCYSAHPVWTAAGTWYAFILSNGTSDLYFAKTTDYGVTWNINATAIKAGTIIGLAVWFDKWTPGDSGTLIHLAYVDSDSDDVFYRQLETATDTLGTEISVFAGASASAPNSSLSITKSKAGRILIAYDINGASTETGFYKSDDFPVTAFTVKSQTAFHEAASTDYYQLFPANLADTNDIWALFLDRSANEITLKTYDDSGDSWSAIAESAAIMTCTEVAATTALPQMAGAVRSSDGNLILAAWDSMDTAGALLRVFDITNASTITEKTKVIDDGATNANDDQALVAVGLDSVNGTIYVFYCGVIAGTSTAYTSLPVYYKTSTDGGTTWSSAATADGTLLSSAARSIHYLFCSQEFASGDFVVMWGGAEEPGATELSMRFSAYR